MNREEALHKPDARKTNRKRAKILQEPREKYCEKIYEAKHA